MSQSMKMGLMVIVLFYAVFSILMVELYRERHLHFFEMVIFIALMIAAGVTQALMLSAKVPDHGG